MAFKCLLLLFVSVLGLSHSSVVDQLVKCALNDSNCQKENFQNAMTYSAVTGIPEYNIPPFDPTVVKDMDVSIPNIINMKVIEGEVRGIKDCVIEKFKVSMKHLHATSKFTCNITVEGEYKISSAGNEILTQIIGGPFDGEGHGKIEIVQVTISLVAPFVVEKRGDDIYLTGDVNNQKHSFETPAKVIFSADKLSMGDRDATKEIVALMNKNWKEATSTFGGHFFDLAMGVGYNSIQNFFNNCPAKLYIIDDLSSYVH